MSAPVAPTPRERFKAAFAARRRYMRAPLGDKASLAAMTDHPLPYWKAALAAWSGSSSYDLLAQYPLSTRRAIYIDASLRAAVSARIGRKGGK